jgi:hypothetical protein
LYNLVSKGEVLLFALFMQSAGGTLLGFYVIILPLVAVLGFAVYLLIRGYRAPRRGRYRHLDDPRPAIGGLVGGLVGAVVGYLLGTSPSLSFGDVLESGANLQGINALMRPAAEAASNWMLAGAIVGVVGGLIVAYWSLSRPSPAPRRRYRDARTAVPRLPPGWNSAASVEEVLP